MPSTLTNSTVQIFFRAIVVLCALAVGGAYALGTNVAALPRPAGPVTYLDRGGAPLGTVLASDANHAIAVPLTAIAPPLQRAMIAAEDARFYEHGAIDIRGLVRAMRELFVYGEFRSGGSTIAMQLARLLHPSAATLRGKLLQIARAERIAMRSERDAILEAYLNRAPMGGNIYGAEAAARTYFGTPASDLDLAQASVLASIPNDPTHLAPDEHLGAARARAAYVLDRMLKLGMIHSTDRARALHESLRVARHDSGIADAAHAMFYLYGLSNQHARIRTTLDRGLQRFVQTQVQAIVAALGSRHVTDAAALVVDNRSGDVLAYVGSPDYFSDAALGRNDGVQALRQPGSSLKPFTYELALERGAITSTTILPDVPSTFPIPGGKLYQPADYTGSFSGPVRVRYALANSLNVPAVRVLSAVGPEALLARLRELGFSHLDKPASYYGLGLTLGGGEVSLWENVHAYLAMARNGNAIPLRLTFDARSPQARVGDRNTWQLVTNMLADQHARMHAFGMHSILDMPFDAAVKTGTSSDFRDTWTVGFTRDYTVGTWVGNFDGSAMRGVSGVTGAGPLWNRIMLHLHEQQEPKRFDVPHGYENLAICATTGHAPARDCPAVVREWVKPSEVAGVMRPASGALDARYNDWLAQQTHPPVAGLRILEPHDGATFYYHAPQNGLQARAQMIELRAGGATRVAWSVNGAPLSVDAEGNAFLPLAVGTFSIEARAATTGARDRVTVRVVPKAQSARPGFSFSSNPSKLK